MSAEIREALGPDALKVTLDGQPLADFWLRTEVPVAESPSSELGVAFGQLPLNTLLGVVRLGESWSDYKGEPVSAGVYTLRYGVNPADGNHMGVGIYRDYLMLVPVADDTTVDVDWQPELLWEKSKAATGTPHPAVLALFPMWDEVSEPALVKNEMDQWTVAVPLGSMSPQPGLVVQGHGEV